jgi:hypothetical protein
MERLINIDNVGTRRSIEGAPISIPMSDVQSSGVGKKTLAMLPVVFGVAGYAMVFR